MVHSLLRYTTTQERCLNIIGLAACMGAGAVQPLMNIPFGQITNDFVQFTQGDKNQKSNGSVVFFLYLAIGSFVSTYLSTSIFVWTSETTTSRIRAKTLKSLLSQEVSYYQDGAAVTLTADMEADLDAIQSGISEKVPTTVMYLSLALTGFIVAIVKAWNLGLALLSMLPCLLLIGYLMTKFGFAYIGKVMGAMAPAASFSQEALGGITTIRSLGAETSVVDKVTGIQNGALGVARIKSLIWGGCMAGMTLVIYLGYALCFGFGGQLFRKGGIEAGTLVTAFLSVMMGSFAFSQVPSNLHSFVLALKAANKLDQIIQREPAIVSPPNAPKLYSVDKIQLCNISFAYPSRPNVPVLRNVDITVNKGETVAIVGHSGSGKSTVASLLLGLHLPQTGQVLYDSADIRSVDLASLRGELVASVLQEPQLFDVSIFDNVALGMRASDRRLPNEYKDQIVHEACRIAQADEFIKALPQGYDTMAGEAGVKISGGQKARIAIARALVRRAPVLLLDEATANLDTGSERALQAALETSAKGRTTIVIAHRLSTVRKADRIIVMHDGEVIDEGTHDTLMMDISGPYYRLFQAEPTDRTESSPPPQIETSKEVAPSKDEDDLLKADLSTGGSLDKDEDEPHQSHDPRTGACIRAMATFAKMDLLIVSLGILGSIVAGGMYPGFAIAYAQAYSTFGEHPHDAKTQNLNAVWFVILALGGALGIFAQWYCLGYASDRMACALRSAMLRKVLRAPMEFFDEERNTSGQLTTIINTSPTRVSTFVGTAMGTFIASVSTLVGGCIVGLVYSWKLGLVNMAVLPLTLGTGIIRLKVFDSRVAKLKKFNEPANRTAIAAVGQIETIASLAAEQVVFDKYTGQLSEARGKTKWMAWVSSVLFALAQSNMYFVVALGFWYGSTLVYSGEINSRAFFAVFTAIVAGSFQAANVLTQAPELSQARGAALDIGRLLKLDSEKAGGSLSAFPQGDTRLDNVFFTYPSRDEPSLVDLSLIARHHSFTALCGPSGSGKSTVIRLLERFYDPSSGLITLGGQPIGSIEESAFRKSVALVSQEPVLFNLTIRENILFGAETRVQDEELWEVLKLVNLDTFVRELPDGLETDLGAKGVALSGGQRQRLVLARALLRRPSLLLLDEATSSLDHANQRAVQLSIDALARDPDRPLTVISVAHRLSTIRDAEVIYVMRSGRLVESGAYDALVSRGGLFASLAMSGDS